MSDCSKSEKRWLKAELHAHCNLDPADYRICPHSPHELISRAAKLGYEVLAITCHDLDIWTEELSEYAADLGITLIPGMEVTVEGTRHTLVYNFRAEARHLNTFDKLRTLSREDTLVIAPHPYFPGRTCLGRLLEKNLDLFDAIESSGFETRVVNFNRRSEALAERAHKPVVGNADVHYLWQLGRTYTWIYSEPGVLQVLNAVKQGFVRVQKSRLTWLEAAEWWATTLWRNWVLPVNAAPGRPPVSDKIKDGRCFGPAQEGMEP